MQKARRQLLFRRIGTWPPTGCKCTVSGTISLFCSKCFSPFPHGTSSLSVSQEYLALPDGAGRFPQDFSGPAVLRILLGNGFVSLTGLSPSMVQLSRSILLRIQSPLSQSYNLQMAVTTWIWAVSRSLATTWEITIVFYSSGY
jgi:hypothetical protein